MIDVSEEVANSIWSIMESDEWTDLFIAIPAYNSFFKSELRLLSWCRGCGGMGGWEMDFERGFNGLLIYETE